MATVNLGRIKPQWQGTYASETSYVVDDMVLYNNSAYICTAASQGNAPTNTSYWDLMTQGSDIPTGGSASQVLTNDGSDNYSWSDPAVSGGFNSMQVFTSSGTWTKPAGVNLIKVYVTGGGGGGGGYGNASDNGGGGGAGGTAIKVIDVSSISSVAVTIGGGGSEATGWDQNGNSGGTSSFGTHCSASGGAGGRHGNFGGVIGGVGGVGSGGDLNLRGNGGDGGNDDGSGDWHGPGRGGSSFWGGANPAPARGQNTNYDSSEGAGGPGGNAQSAATGGSGGAGIVVVEEYR